MTQHASTSDAQPSYLALCSECGTVRTLATLRQSLGRDTEYGEHWWGGERCMILRRCATCDRLTRHAYLRGDAARDELEAHNEAVRRFEAFETVTADDVTAELVSLGVEVADDWDGAPLLVRTLDDGRYHLWLSVDLDPGERLAMLRGVAGVLWVVPGLRWHVQAAGGDHRAWAYLTLA